MLQIPLTRGYTALVDDAWFPYLNQWKWHVHLPGRKLKKEYACRNEAGGKVYMHRVVSRVQMDLDVDHIDGNGLNNQESNLRAATRTQNNWNARKRDSSTPYIGVFYLDPSKPIYARYALNPYKASVQVKGKKIHVGYFTTADEAAKARDDAALEHFGPFAVFNFPR